MKMEREPERLYQITRRARPSPAVDSPVDLGGVQCIPLDGGSLHMEIPLTKPLRLNLMMRPLLVRAWWGTIILDPAAGEFDAQRWEKYGVQPPEMPLVHQLEKNGIRARDIDLVFLSHLHFDHACGALGDNKPLFPRADYLIQEREWEAAIAKGSGVARMFKQALPTSRLRLLKGDCQIAPGLEAWLTPGHSAGLMVCRIGGRGDEAFFLSDLLPVTRSLTLQPDRFSDPDPELALHHRTRVVDHMLAHRSLAFYYHDVHKAASRIVSRPTGGGVRTAPAYPLGSV